MNLEKELLKIPNVKRNDNEKEYFSLYKKSEDRISILIEQNRKTGENVVSIFVKRTVKICDLKPETILDLFEKL